MAAIDCGTNSIRLLIAETVEGRGPGSGRVQRQDRRQVQGRGQDAPPDAALTDLERLMRIVRLGHGVDRTGRFDDDAIARTLEATREYAELIRGHGVPLNAQHVRFVATSATRDAENRDAFLDGVEQILGVRPEVISGAEEAALSFRGAVSVLAEFGLAALVVDLGGGSTELVLGRGEPESSVSLDVGCVRLTERHVRADPASAADLAAIRADTETALKEASAAVDLSRASTVIGVAGTITTVTAHALGLTSYDRDAIHEARLPLWVAVAAANDLASLSREQRAALPYMHPGRVDVIAAGATVWATILERVAAGSTLDEVVTSERDILDGIALSLL